MSEQLISVGPRINWSRAALLAAGVAEGEIQAAAAAEIIADCHAQIDGISDRVFTSSASRAARYQRKEAEARAFLAAEAPVAGDYPMLAAEATARSMTIAALAADVVAAADAYTALAAGVEAARASARIAIEAAPTIAAMRAASTSAIAGVAAAIGA
jgi:hypothetical protein